MSKADDHEDVIVINNYINGKFVEPTNHHSNSSNNNDSSSYLNVTNPSNGRVIGKVAISDHVDVNHAVQSASDAFHNWNRNYTIKSRAAILLKFHHLVQVHSTELAELIVRENGKNITEALADVAKGNETVEYAAGIANSTHGSGNILPVSSGGNILCEDRKQPVGVVVSIVPFNFPFMVPMWTLPIALVLGNTVILKPSEKVPLTMHRTIALWEEAGLPPGCLNIVQGTRTTVEALIQHPQVTAVTFVGSSPVAESIAQQCTNQYDINRKRCIALGGAKNHLLALSDCHIASTAQDIVTSFCGCAGQRCMAASVLLLVNNQNNPNTNASQHSTTSSDHDTTTLIATDGQPINLQNSSSSSSIFVQLVNTICQVAKQIQPGTGSGQMGPVIDQASYHKVISYIDHAVNIDGAQLLLDGRCSDWVKNTEHDNTGSPASTQSDGYWIGPTILYHHNCTDKTMVEEIFGPVLSIYHCQSWKEAIQIEHNSPYGNAASIYTTNGGHAQYFLSQLKATMLGCNIGIPVPREPFSFGGLYGTKSKYGTYHGDITGDSAIEFFTNRVKVTSKWPSIDPTMYDHQSNTSTTTMDANLNHKESHLPNKKAKVTNDNITAVNTTITDTAVIDHASFAGRM
jgi:acyl-CoA reductase-like NAD-dependent aldehyde dehydrogenase